jgi:hypothetical protein
VAITDKIYVKNHRRIGDQHRTSIPRGAFSGATLDLLFAGEVDPPGLALPCRQARRDGDPRRAPSHPPQSWLPSA